MSAVLRMTGEGGRESPKFNPPAELDRKDRFRVLFLGVLGAALFTAAYFQPWWDFALFAPQYPKGLRLVISLTGVTGDVAEINIINHYIGMHGLDQAASLERAIAGWGVGAVGMMVLLFLLGSGKSWGWLATLPALALPLGFILDSFYWLHRFGHELDPKAPITMKPFTPTLFGEGKVGQFRTLATPGTGFWLAVAGVLMVGGAVVLRRRACQECARREECGKVCAGGFVGGTGAPPQESR